jgi:hypothetical protein
MVKMTIRAKKEIRIGSEVVSIAGLFIRRSSIHQAVYSL